MIALPNAGPDPALPTLALALDPAVAQRELPPRLAEAFPGAAIRVMDIVVVRHKPGRRCLVEYLLELGWRGRDPEAVSVLGKVRANRFGKSGLRLQRALTDAGFDERSSDGISVPAPLGHVPMFHMWLQRKVPGRVLTDLVAGAAAEHLAARVAGALLKLHRAGVASDRRHTVADELAILRGRLEGLARARPDLGGRIARVREACGELGRTSRCFEACGIHRDMYPDQILVDETGRMFLLDLDLYCVGDPAVDLGNYVAHIREQSLRDRGDPYAFAVAESVVVDAYLDRASVERTRVEVYTTLSLARLAALSAEIEGRGRTTEPLLRLCERRLRIEPAYSR